MEQDNAAAQEFVPPARLTSGAAEAWTEITAAHGRRASRIIGPELEIYCEAIAAVREARGRARGGEDRGAYGAAFPGACRSRRAGIHGPQNT